MSLVIDLIGQLNCYNILLAVRLIKVDWCILIRLLFCSVYCLSVLVSLISCFQGAGSCWHWFSGICSKLVNQLSRVSRW